MQTPLIQVLGLDQRDNHDASSRVPDGLVDPEYINYDEGRLWFPDLRPFDPGPADVQGNDYRARSWPKVTGLSRPDLSRPDTLGWRPGRRTAVRSSEQVLAEETAPEIYDLRPDVLSREAAEAPSLQHRGGRRGGWRN